jgi:hypothetical protein
MTTDALVADAPTASTTQSGFMDILALQLAKTPIDGVMHGFCTKCSHGL